MIQDIAPHVLRNEFIPDRAVEDRGLLFAFRGDSILCGIEEDLVRLPWVEQWPGAFERRFLFELDGVPCYLAVTEEEPPVPGMDFVPVRALRQRAGGPRELIFAAWTAYQLRNWYVDNRYCGRCGTPTALAGNERAVQCPGCGRRIYPRIIPAVIVGVTNGDEILTTRYRGRGIGYDALIAGFTEIGETLEQTVAREVMEEAGLRVRNIRYYKSQPWGIVDDLLMGFYCDVDGSTEIHMDERELKEARWVRREDVVGQPNDFSLTNEMMTRFREGLEPR